MIGIICSYNQRPVVTEFFELFKVPWEFYAGDKHYDVVLITVQTAIVPTAQLLIIFGSERQSWDLCDLRSRGPGIGGVLVEHQDVQFPIYLDMAIVDLPYMPIMTVVGTTEAVASEYRIGAKRVLRIGYDLFAEVGFLLSQGQPVSHAAIPSLDIHISMLRKWIIESGLLLIEIPPVPSGYNFVVCLTHDVDFINIRDHKLDRSLVGFIARALFSGHLRDTKSRIAWSRLAKNWRAVFSLPAVYFGLCRDIWFDIDRYIELERGLGSTFYFIPLKGHAGESKGRPEPHWRAARYDVRQYGALIAELERESAEIGVHGLDAWHDPQKGLREREIIRSLSGEESAGIRMHWLYFSKQSPKILEEAGFMYDSTFGYNEANGFRCGTTQVFCLPGGSRLLELSLNLMDTALFYSGRMGLSEAEAMQECKSHISTLRHYGGVLTINWHTRSLSPERNWDSFYRELIDRLRLEKVWFATAKAAVEWFRQRRQIRFEEVAVTPRGVKVRLCAMKASDLPGFTLRVHHPGRVVKMVDRGRSSQISNWTDVPLTGEPELEVAI